MKILIETIPHSEQRYPTVGDWQWEQGTGPAGFEGLSEERAVLHIRVSQMSDWRYEALVGLHEAIEALLCKHAGVSEAIVDAFDMNFKGEGEPGDDSGAPYYSQHQNATTMETILAGWFGVNWSKYDDEVNSL
jgi:hypothetical protein